MDDRSNPLPAYDAPARPNAASGKERRVGLELEFAQLSLDDTLEVLRACLGGTITRHSLTEAQLDDTSFGKFKVELDSTTLKERAYLKPLERLGLASDSAFMQSIEESVIEVARELVPIEVVTPPIPWSRLHELDGLWHALREGHAAGTQASIFYAFGLHLNPEPADFEVASLLAVLRSFLLLEDSIRRLSGTDLTRRIAPYIQSFPEPYRRMVLAPDYEPDWTSFVDDYVSHNPTRNRSLDLLPLIMHVRAPDLFGRVEDLHLVGARPTYHYRLPNCEIGRPGWSPAVDWNRWLVVEHLAEEKVLLDELATAYLETLDLPLRLQSERWADQVEARIGPLDTARKAWSS